MDPVSVTAAQYFLPGREIVRIEPLGRGNINDTYLVVSDSGEQRVLQRINQAVFPHPDLVQENMRLVCHQLETALSNPDIPERFIPLSLSTGKNGDSFVDEWGGVWRMINYIPGLIFDTLREPEQAKETGRCLGIFHRLVSSLDPSCLADTLPGFHDTPLYLDKYDRACADFPAEMDNEIHWCKDFISAHRSLATRLEDIIGLDQVVIHGDPKVANFIFAENGRKAISLIDLDTVRSGLLLHDIGDALRSCCNPAGESPEQKNQVQFSRPFFSAWLQGYCQEARLLLTDQDKEHIVDAIQVIAFELGLRFFTDYMHKNTYFKIEYPEHNLNRAMVQFQLVDSIKEQQQDLEAIVQATCG